MYAAIPSKTPHNTTVTTPTGLLGARRPGWAPFHGWLASSFHGCYHFDKVFLGFWLVSFDLNNVDCTILYYITVTKKVFYDITVM